MRFLHSNSTLHWPSIVRRLIRLPSIVIRHRFKWKLSICLNMQRIHDLLCRTVGSTARASVYSNSEFQKESTKRSREEFAVCNAPEHPEAWGCRFSKRIAPNCVHPFPWSLKRQTSCPFESAFYHRETEANCKVTCWKLLILKMLSRHGGTRSLTISGGREIGRGRQLERRDYYPLGMGWFCQNFKIG